MTNYTKLEAKYNKLSSSAQDCLKMFTLAIETVDLSGGAKTLRSIGIKTLDGESVTQKSFQQVIQPLIDAQFIIEHTKTKFSINIKVHRFCFKKVLGDERINNFIKGIREQYPIKESEEGFYSYRYKSFRNYEVGLREMQFALVEKNGVKFQEHSKNVKSDFYKDPNPIPFFFGAPFEKDFLQLLPIDTQVNILESLLMNAIYGVEPIADYESCLLEAYAIEPNNIRLKKLLGTLFIYQGKLKDKDAFFEAEEGNLAWVAFLKGENDKAITLFTEDFKIIKKETRKKKVFLRYNAAPFYLLALLKKKEPSNHSLILKHAENAYYQSNKQVIGYMIGLMLHLKNEKKEAKTYLEKEPYSSLNLVFYGVIAFWINKELTKEEIRGYEKFYTLATNNSLLWLALEYATILSKLHTDQQKQEDYAAKSATLQKDLGIESMLMALQKVEEWELVLRAFEGMTSKGTISTLEEGGNARIAWLVGFESHAIQPKLQTKNKSGTWSKGRNIALKRLYRNEEDAATTQDQPIINAIYEEQSSRYYGGTDYYINFEKALKGMVGHPRLFLYNNPSVLVELTAVKPELIVEENAGKYEVKFSHDVSAEGISINKETPTRYNFVQVDPIHQEIAKAMGKTKVSIPKVAKKRLSAFLSKLGTGVVVNSKLAHSEENLPTKKGDSTIHVHLLPFGEGFKLEMFCKPADDGPYFKPGSGRVEFVAEIKKKRTLIKRSLKKEKEQARKVEEACTTLQKIPSYQGEWTFDDTETCLNILLELEAIKDKKLVKLEWPKGEKIKLNHQQVGFDQFSMRIDRDNDWFGISGELQLGDKEVMDMRLLLDLIDQNENSRFVEIKDGQFIALTTAFKKKLSAMNSYLDRSSNGIKAHNLSVVALEDFTDQVANLEAAKEWKQQLSRLKKARKLKVEVPSTFQAELRAYQLEGYEWLQRLAYWGVGACLADDMGLGKTIQGLAVLVERASKGPALVVAPASVCRNWLRECQRFAPTLNPTIFGSGDRKKTIKGLKKHDLLITTYGLLHQEEALLTNKKFGTIILDEAQAIKNRTAKRSKAAMNLQGAFKIITTGTPIENHLGELWNLFHFLNRGLLGSYESFQNKYAIPIERDKNSTIQQHLKKLIQPFILRRRKSDVLEDLPSKTEITLSVELSKAERAFYEALRQTAIEKIAEGQAEKGHPGMQILAEITRLRQACCHPKLVNKDIALESAKLQLLEEVVEDLVSSGHKALIFSQFVGHLKIIEALMQKKKINYQYLDGQTSLKKREERINAFQSGEGDVFLISLKAGGVGLNLTAADYVIHTDPWWNPAVEDQASDRAHRIGQKRPVTIYRLVTANTIEEKIVALHHHKRDLADGLLEGTERSARLSSEDLLALIKEG